MSKVIGLVAGKHADVAEQIRSAILSLDPGAEVLVDSELPRHDAPTPRIALGDKKIHHFNAVRRLAARGAQAVGFCCGCPHSFLGELQTETTVPLADPVGADGERVPPAEYAKALLSLEGPRPKPFKVGLIGGLGPAATVDLYDKLVRFTPAKCDQEHFKVVVEQNPQTPDRTAALLEGGVDPTLALYNGASRLEADGCDAIIIPCNTAHAFIPYL